MSEWGITVYTLSDRLSEIQKALDCKLYQSALSLALTVPDICGQINYPHLKKTGERYKKWFDNYVKNDYIYNPEYSQDHTAFTDGKYYFDGAACYALRCAFLHSGNDEVKGKDLAVFKGINDKEEINENTKIKYDFTLFLNTHSNIEILFCRISFACTFESTPNKSLETVTVWSRMDQMGGCDLVILVKSW